MSKIVKLKNSPSGDAYLLDAQAAKDLLIWARKERIVLQHVQVGSVSLVVAADHRMVVEAPTLRDASGEARKGIYEEFAGVLAKDQSTEGTEADETIEPTVEDDDDDE